MMYEVNLAQLCSLNGQLLIFSPPISLFSVLHFVDRPWASTSKDHSTNLMSIWCYVGIKCWSCLSSVSFMGYELFRQELFFSQILHRILCYPVIAKSVIFTYRDWSRDKRKGRGDHDRCISNSLWIIIGIHKWSLDRVRRSRGLNRNQRAAAQANTGSGRQQLAS